MASIIDQTRLCKNCGLVKSVNDFYKRTIGVRYTCKQCTRSQVKGRGWQPSEQARIKRRETSKDWAMQNRDRVHWEIDHRVPKSLLRYDTYEDANFKQCWSLGNLMPLDKTLNRRKHNKMIDYGGAYGR